jgi:hypothetical protein
MGRRSPFGWKVSRDSTTTEFCRLTVLPSSRPVRNNRRSEETVFGGLLRIPSLMFIDWDYYSEGCTHVDRVRQQYGHRLIAASGVTYPSARTALFRITPWFAPFASLFRVIHTAPTLLIVGFSMPRDHTESPGDRRKNRRYAISLPVRINVVKGGLPSDDAIGKMLNMSSSGLAFTSDVSLNVGAVIELSINWPILLHDNVPVQLVVQGIIIRTDGQVIGVDITNYQFGTRRRQL